MKRKQTNSYSIQMKRRSNLEGKEEPNRFEDERTEYMLKS